MAGMVGACDGRCRGWQVRAMAMVGMAGAGDGRCDYGGGWHGRCGREGPGLGRGDGGHGRCGCKGPIGYRAWFMLREGGVGAYRGGLPSGGNP